jgi:hypothetical protein
MLSIGVKKLKNIEVKVSDELDEIYWFLERKEKNKT